MKKIIKLTESDLTRIVKRVINERRYLMEADGYTGTNFTATMTVPFIKQKDGKEVFDRSTPIAFKLTGDKDTNNVGQTSLDNITSISGVKIYSETPRVVAAANHGASIYTGGNNEIIKYLTKMVGKTTEVGSKDIEVNTKLVNGGTASYPAQTTFIKKVRPQQ